jgi:hypothetical protein
MNNRYKKPVLLLLLALACLPLFSFGSSDKPDNGKVITVTGRVRLVGTAAFSSLVISDKENNDWYLENDDRQKLNRMEQRQVTVKGKAEYQDMILANGKKVGVRRFLRNITIID